MIKYHLLDFHKDYCRDGSNKVKKWPIPVFILILDLNNFFACKGFGLPTRDKTVGPVLSLLQCAFVLPCRQIHCVSMWPELSRIPAGFSSARAAL